jgi:YHS domain-containing protein
MKKLILALLIGLIVVLALGFSAVKTKPAKADQTEVICPVTGTKITPATAYDKIVYKGKTYYFCCAGCKPLFKKNPEKYIKALKTAPEHKHEMQGIKM